MFPPVGDYVKALECAKSYLLFHPDDEDVLENAGYYEGLLEGTVDPATIKPRKVRVSDTSELLVGGFNKQPGGNKSSLAAFPQWDHFEKRSRSAGLAGAAELVIFRVQVQSLWCRGEAGVQDLL